MIGGFNIHEDFEIVHSESGESDSHDSHHHSDGEHHSSHHHSGNSHHQFTSHHSKATHKRKRIIIGVVIGIILILGLGGAFGAVTAKKEISDIKQQAVVLKADLKNVLSALKAQDADSTFAACDELDIALDNINATLDKPLWRMVYKVPKFKGYIDSVEKLLSLVDEASNDIARPTAAVFE